MVFVGITFVNFDTNTSCAGVGVVGVFFCMSSQQQKMISSPVSERSLLGRSLLLVANLHN